MHIAGFFISCLFAILESFSSTSYSTGMKAAYNRFGCHSCRLCGWLSGSSSGVLAQRNPQVKLVLILLQTGRCRFSHSCPASQMLPVDHQATWHVWFVVLFLRHGCCKKATVSPAIRYFIGTASACILAHRSPVLVFCCEIP